LKLKISEGDIFTNINGIVHAYRFIASQKNITYDYSCSRDSYKCYFDPDKIEKILYNLLSNAFKYTPQNGWIHILIDFIGKEEKPAEIQIKVSNSARIIPPEQLARIFERFYQADSSGNTKIPGTGIGLALTQDLVSIYRGTIEVTSNSADGTTFTVTLPVSLESFACDEIVSDMPEVDELTLQLIAIEGQTEDRDSADQKNSEERSGTVDAAAVTKPTILIVDDNSDIRTYLKYNLSDEYETMEAINGTEGLKKALDCIPKLVICDVMMPGMDGYELCAEIKTDIRTCHIPVIILTAKASEEDRLESIETGADAYIAKPFDLRVLKTRIKQLISSREQLKQLFRRELTIGPSTVLVESTDEALMKRILKVMSNNISDPDFGVEELGKEVGLSRTHLYRKIKQLNGSTAIEFVRNMRLQRAAQLFEQNKLYVAEVAYQSGFKELSYFRKIFKDFYGMSPKEYIRKCGGNPAD
ncbi:MAG: response regulator, partial [Bacteroidota bacterium]